MKMVVDKANSRGYANHGWLKTYHTFSFANYYNPKRVHFGMLRVLNDDTVAPSEGFDTHPHKNMEVISIPLMAICVMATVYRTVKPLPRVISR